MHRLKSPRWWKRVAGWCSTGAGTSCLQYCHGKVLYVMMTCLILIEGLHMCEAHMSVMCFTEPYKAKKYLILRNILLKKQLGSWQLLWYFIYIFIIKVRALAELIYLTESLIVASLIVSDFLKT